MCASSAPSGGCSFHRGERVENAGLLNVFWYWKLYFERARTTTVRGRQEFPVVERGSERVVTCPPKGMAPLGRGAELACDCRREVRSRATINIKPTKELKKKKGTRLDFLDGGGVYTPTHILSVYSFI